MYASRWVMRESSGIASGYQQWGISSVCKDFKISRYRYQRSPTSTLLSLSMACRVFCLKNLYIFGQWLREEMGMFVAMHDTMKQENTEIHLLWCFPLGWCSAFLKQHSKAYHTDVLWFACFSDNVHIEVSFYTDSGWIYCQTQYIICKVFAYLCSF